MSSSPARLDDLQQKFTEQPRRYFAPLANALRQAGDVDAAVELCRGYLAELPDHLSGHVVLALALRDRGDLDGSRAEFERALALDAENVLALRALGELACRRGDERDATLWYERLVAVDPHDPDAVSRLAALRADVGAAEHLRADQQAAWAPRAPEGAVAESPTAEAPSAAAPMERVEEPTPVEEGVFTAGIFAPVLDEPTEPLETMAPGAATDESAAPAESAAEPAPPEEPAEPQPTAEAGEAPADAEPRVSQSVYVDAADLGELDVDRDLAALLPSQDEALRSDDIDRLFAELPPLGATLDVPSSPSFGSEGATGDEFALASDNPLDDALASTAEFTLPGETEPLGGTPAEGEVAPAEQGVPPAEEPVAEAPAMEEPLPDLPLVEEPLADEPILQAPILEEPPVEEPPLEEPRAEEPVAAAEPPVEEPVAPAPSAATEEPAAPAAEPRVAFVTETMAELYLKQGFRAEARHVYEQLLAQNPDDAALRARVDELSASAPGEGAQAEHPPMEWEDAVRGLASIELTPEPAAPDVAPAGEAGARTVADWLRGLTSATPEPAASFPEPATSAPTAEEPATQEPAAEQPLAEQPLAEQPLAEQPLAEEPAVQEQVAAEPAVEDVARYEAEPAPELVAEAQIESEPVVEPGPAAEPAEGIAAQPTAEEDPFGWGEVASSEPVAGPMTPPELAGVNEMELVEEAAAEPPATSAPSLDELFARPVSPAAEAAAGTLVAATLSLQEDREIDAQLSQAASDDPASLEHVLREAPPAAPARPTPTFSFEQFFTPALGTTPAPEQPTTPAPADGAAAGDDDLDEFHAWLAGLSDS